MEHPNLAPDTAAGQDVRLLVVQGEGRPGQSVEVFLHQRVGRSRSGRSSKEMRLLPAFHLDILVLVLHQHRAGVDVYNTDRVAPVRRGSS